MIAVYGLAAFSITAPNSTDISLLPDNAALVASLNASFIYLAVAAGGLGGVMISSAGAGRLGPVAPAFVLLALGASERAHRSSV